MAGSPQKRARREAAKANVLTALALTPAPVAPKLEGGRTLTVEQVAEYRIQVLAMVHVGLAQEQIAYLTGLDRETLRARFPEELKAAKVIANGLMASAMLRKGLEGDVRAQELWMRENAGWFQTQRPGVDIPPELARELEEARALKAQLGGPDAPEAANDRARRSLLIEFVDAQEAAG